MSDLSKVSEKLKNIADEATALQQKTEALQVELATAQPLDPFVAMLTIFVLACFVGYYVVWKVTPALHTPLMSVTNAISGIIVLGAIIAVGPESGDSMGRMLGFIAVVIASVNIFGGFIVTHRMLSMYKKKS